MFCGKCGTQIPDGAAFCPSCGNTAGAQAPVTNEVQQQVNAAPKKKVNLIAVGAIAAIVVAIAIILICVFAGGGAGAGSPEALVEKYVEATLDMDVDTLFECLNEDMIKAAAEDEGVTVKEMKAELKEEVEEYKAMMESMNIKMSYEIIDTEDVEGDELDEIKEEIADDFDIKVTAAAMVSVEMVTEALGEENTQTETFCAIKIDGEWYLHPDSFDM